MKLKWIKASKAPDEAFALVVAIEITCNCAKGAQTVITGGRMNGEWVFSDAPDHDFEITHFMELPKPPFRKQRLH